MHVGSKTLRGHSWRLYRMNTVRFDARDIPTYAEPLSVDDLRAGSIYFLVTFADEDMLVPIMHTAVYVGADLEPGDKDRVYFQDLESFKRGVRFDTSGDGDYALIEVGQ